jgi:hypothetical protein
MPQYRVKDYFKLIVDTEIDLKNFEWVVLESYGSLIDLNKEFDL